MPGLNAVAWIDPLTALTVVGGILGAVASLLTILHRGRERTRDVAMRDEVVQPERTRRTKIRWTAVVIVAAIAAVCFIVWRLTAPAEKEATA